MFIFLRLANSNSSGTKKKKVQKPKPKPTPSADQSKVSDELKSTTVSSSSNQLFESIPNAHGPDKLILNTNHSLEMLEQIPTTVVREQLDDGKQFVLISYFHVFLTPS